MKYNVFIIENVFTLLLAQIIIEQSPNSANILVIINSQGMSTIANPVLNSTIILNNTIFKKELWNDIRIIDYSKFASSLSFSAKNIINYKKNIKNLEANLKEQFSDLRNIDDLYCFNHLATLHRILVKKVFNSKKNIFIEEGMGAYEKYKIIKNSAFKNLIQEILIGFARLGDVMLIKANFDIFDELYLLFPEKAFATRKFKGKINNLDSILNKNNLKNYGEILNNIKMPITECPNVLYIHTPFSRNNWVKLEEEKAFVEFILNYLKNLNVNIIIKPHPRDKADYIEYFEELEKKDNNFYLIKDHRIPVEILALKLKPVAAISPCSSSLLYLKSIYNIDTFFLMPLLIKWLKNPKKLTAVMKKLSLHLFKDNAHFVEDENDLKMIERFLFQNTLI